MSDSVYRTDHPHARVVWCEDCEKVWREPCAECAQHFVDYHRQAFEGHRVTINAEHRRPSQKFDVPASVSNLFGRY